MKLKLLNGNGFFYTTGADLTLCIQHEYINDGYLTHVKKETGINFIKRNRCYIATPKNAMQIVKFLTHASTRAFKLSYTDNLDYKNTLFFQLIDRD